MEEREMALLAAEIARKINDAAEKGKGTPTTILDLVIPMVAPDWRLVNGRD